MLCAGRGVQRPVDAHVLGLRSRDRALRAGRRWTRPLLRTRRHLLRRSAAAVLRRLAVLRGDAVHLPRFVGPRLHATMSRSACAEQIRRVALAVLLAPALAAADCGECTGPSDCVPSFSRCFSATCTADHCCTDVPVDCDDHLACTTDSCSEALGCQHADACNDGNPCNGEESCLPFGTDHLCVAGVPLDCDDGDACTVDQCRPDGCAHDAIDCDDHDPCTADACDHTTGCTHTAIPGCCTSDAACERDACVQAARCTGGTCGDGVAVDCDDGNACTADSCDASLGCVHAPIACNDGDPCTRDACDPAIGCTHAGVAGCCNEDLDCRTDPCTAGATCASHSCVGGRPVRCDDGDPCTSDRCVPNVGCTADPLSGPEAARCVCDRAMPDPCNGITVPHAVGAVLARSCTLIRRATAPGTPAARVRKLAGRAAHRFAKGATIAAHEGAKGELGPACAGALGAQLEDGSRRATAFRATVP